MRVPIILAMALVACSDGGGKAGPDNAASPAPAPTGPPPLTPRTDVTPAPGEVPAWGVPQSNATDPKTAPYDDLDAPVVNAPDAK